MLETPHTPLDSAARVYSWYTKAQVDYTEHYFRLYIAYNAWYRQVTGTTNDREAIGQLKKRFIIWDDYTKGKTLNTLKLYCERISTFTTLNPLPGHMYWSGKLDGAYDWRNLIEYWYQVRCMLVHGSEVHPKHVWLAYETLDAFMSEIITRMRSCFTESDMERLKEVTNLASTEYGKTERFKVLQKRLHQKYIASPDIWQVDMQRAASDSYLD
ncbi:MAG: hypothetical protein WAR37_00140 [Candidatus Microsaccharimonas sp.]